MKVRIRHIGKHQPKGMISRCLKETAEKLVKSGNWEYIEEKPIETQKVEDKKPTSQWTEREIKQWIEKKKIPIKYNITNDEKSDILKKLKSGGHI